MTEIKNCICGEKPNYQQVAFGSDECEEIECPACQRKIRLNVEDKFGAIDVWNALWGDFQLPNGGGKNV